MAGAFDSLAASLAAIIEAQAAGTLTTAQAATQLTPVLEGTSDGEFAQRVQELVTVSGRLAGIHLVDVVPPATRPSNLIGAPGSGAWDATRGVFYGPKDAVTGWPAGKSLGDAMPEALSGAELVGWSNSTKFVTAAALAGAKAISLLSLTAPDLHIENQRITLAGHSTLGAAARFKPGLGGRILFFQPLTGGPYTLSFHSSWRPVGATPALSTAPGALDVLEWFAVQEDIILYHIKRWG